MRNTTAVGAIRALVLAMACGSGLAQGVKPEAELTAPILRPAAPQPTNAPAPPPRSPAMRKDALRLLEEQLSKSLQVFSPREQMDPIKARPGPAPVRPTAAAARKNEELLDRKRNWAFTQAEDFAGTQTAEEMFNIPGMDADGQPKKKAKAVEEYYNRLKAESATASRSSSGEPNDPLENRRSMAGSGEDRGSREEPAWVQRTEESLRGLLDRPERGLFTDATTTRGSVRNPYATGSYAPDLPGGAGAPNSYLQQYRQMFDDPGLYPSLNVNSFAQPAPATAAVNMPSLGGLGEVGSATRTESGSLKPVGLPSATPDLNSQVLNRWNPLESTAPAPPPARRSSPGLLHVEPGRRR